MKELSLKEAAKILGISRTATEKEIKKAFKEKSFVCHPDRGGDQAEFIRINHAYKTMLLKPHEQRMHGKRINDMERDFIIAEVFDGDKDAYEAHVSKGNKDE